MSIAVTQIGSFGVRYQVTGLKILAAMLDPGVAFGPCVFSIRIEIFRDHQVLKQFGRVRKVVH